MLYRLSTDRFPSPAILRQRYRRVWIALAIVSTVILAAALYGAGLYGRSIAIQSVLNQGRTDQNLKIALLRAVLERPRALPLLLADDRQIGETLAGADDQAVKQLDRKLESLVFGTRASVLYVINRNGIAIASSNWRDPLSFVGNDYTFRDYFRRAMEEGTAEHYALGNTSNRPGLYISRRVGDPKSPIGVVVVKMEFDQLEADWREAGRPTYVTDDHGVVLVTSIPSWRFMTAGPLPPESLAAIRRSRQFGDAPLVALPIRRPQPLDPDTSIVQTILPGGETGEYLHLKAEVPSTPWALNYLVPTEGPTAAAVRESRFVALAGLLPILAMIAFLFHRRHVSAMELAVARMARDELERRVLERTDDLSRARDRLEAEISGHRSTEAKLQVVQQELVQANRLAILGQVAAGVAHEINQPVATIRAYADNAKIFLERQQLSSARDNLGLIASLTERIGTITEELKAFARKGRTAPEPVDIRSAIEGAVVLLRSRFAGRIEVLDISLPSPGLMVVGTRVRLEQVLINLFQNALEALEGRGDARVEVSVGESRDEISVCISDNGPGIAPAIRDSLFTPFNTSKEKGLGLGLVISKDIAADYGGRIEVESSSEGTLFTLHLKKASV